MGIVVLTLFCSIFNAANKVPQHQREYQAAYRQHVRIWNIVSRPLVDQNERTWMLGPQLTL